MYSGTNKTALCSQKQIAEAFVSLLQKMPYSSVSISAVCKEAGVSRQTFYSLFESKENIVLYVLGKKHHFEPGHSCCQKKVSITELSKEYSNYIFDRKEFLTLLVKNDIIYLMHECLYKAFMDCPGFMPEQNASRRAYGAEFVSGGLAGIVKIFTEQKTESREELEKTIADLFSGDFFRS